MSSRALRKLQKQQELLKRPEDVVNDDESEVEETPKPQALNAFDMLIEADDTDDVEAETSLSTESNDPNVMEAAKQSNNEPSASTGAKKNKARKKKKQKTKGGKDKQSEVVNGKTKLAAKAVQLDEIDLAIKSLPTKSRNGSYAYSNAQVNDGEAEVSLLLGIDSRQLNVMNEMKRLFGKVVLEEDGEGSGIQGPGRRRGRGPQHHDLGTALAGRNSPVSRGQGLAGLALRRNVFMIGKEEWPKATSGGLGMEVDGKLINGITRYRFVHNPVYQDVQSQFEECVDSMQPRRLIALLQFNREIHLTEFLNVADSP